MTDIEFHYAQTLACGHFVEITAFVPLPSRRGELEFCTVCRYHLGKEDDLLHEVIGFRRMEPWEWQGEGVQCPGNTCGPVEDASDFPEVFPMLTEALGAGIEASQLGRCARCGRYWVWSITEQRWTLWEQREVGADGA